MIPKVFKRIPPEDFSMNGIPVLKNNKLTDISVMHGLYSPNPTPVGSIQAENDPINDNGVYQSVFWHSLKHQHYIDQYLSYQPSEITIPYLQAGETIKPGSVKIINTQYGFDLIDDGLGNLYKSNRSDLTHYFNRKCKSILELDFATLYATAGGYTGSFEGKNLINGVYNYKNVAVKFNNVKIFNSQKYNNFMNGMSIHQKSYIHYKHRPEMNLIEGSFLIKFKLGINGWNTGYKLINCNQIRTKNSKGIKTMPVDLNTIDKTVIYDEIEEIYTNCYPFHVEIDNEQALVFKRSDGKTTTQISYTLSESPSEYDVQIYRFPDGQNFKIAMFINGELYQAVNDFTKYTANDYDLIIGNYVDYGTAPFDVTLSDIEIFNKIPYNNSADLINLARALYLDNYNAIVGKIIYKNGQIILSSRFHSDFNYFDNAAVEFTSVHTIYEYDATVRVGKGEFNLSMNPSARVSYESDILIDEFQNGLLKPYITSIGLYDENGNLLVIGKLAQAVEMRDDVDINFVIKWSI